MCLTLFFNKVAGLIVYNFVEKETLAQVFSWEFYEISKNTFFYRTPSVAASQPYTEGKNKHKCLMYLTNVLGIDE